MRNPLSVNKMGNKLVRMQLIILLLTLNFVIPMVHSYKRFYRKASPKNNAHQKPGDARELTPVNAFEGIQSYNQNPVPIAAPAQFAVPPPQGKQLDAEVFKSLLKDLVTRLDSYSGSGPPNSGSNTRPFPPPSGSYTVNTNMMTPGGGNAERMKHINSLNPRHCALKGLWLSTVAGAAIELMPDQQQGHIEIRTKIYDLPDNPYPPLITSKWTGKGIISQESPTTLTIVFQEHFDVPKGENKPELGMSPLPRTAVFVGQCLVCFGNPMLQGTWVVFPATQSCSNSGSGGMSPIVGGKPNGHWQMNSGHNSMDAIYLLRYY